MLRDVKSYYVKMLNQYLELKEDLADFEQGVKDGYVTEEQLVDAKNDVDYVKNNLDRIAYILFLLELPSKKAKKIKYKQANQPLLDYFKELKADEQSVIDDNVSVIAHLREELKKLTK